MLSKIKTKLGNFKETARRSKYAHYYKDYDIEDNIILYDSYFSREINCNNILHVILFLLIKLYL